jgi:bacterioferritin
MKGPSPIIKKLNEVLTNELTAINQYFLHARMFKNWGFLKLGHKIYHESIGEMRHADYVIERILFLEGLPNLQDMHKLKVGETPLECLQADLSVEHMARKTMVEAIALFEESKDYVSRDLISKILEDTEEHIDFLETQLGVIDQIGIQNYLQSQYELPGEKS